MFNANDRFISGISWRERVAYFNVKMMMKSTLY